MITAVYGTIGLATQCPDIWELADWEAKKISKPCARLLKRHPEALAIIAEKSDLAALLMGSVAITAPRILLTKQTKKAAHQAAYEATHNPRPRTQPGVAYRVEPPTPTEQPVYENGKAVDVDGLKSRMQGL